MPDASRHVDHPDSDEYKIEQIGGQLGAALDRRFERERASMGSGNTFNGSTRLIGWLLGINALLIAAAISGGISFAVASSGRLASLEAKMEIIMLRPK